MEHIVEIVVDGETAFSYRLSPEQINDLIDQAEIIEKIGGENNGK